MADVKFSFPDTLVPNEEAIKEAYQNAKAEILTEAGKQLEDLVHSGIDWMFPGNTGKLKRYQALRYGTRGGYAAVRPAKKPPGDNGAGAVTNYTVSGHRIRKPSGKAKRYTPRIRVTRVPANDFYAAAEQGLAKVEETAAKKLAEALAKAWEGSA